MRISKFRFLTVVPVIACLLFSGIDSASAIQKDDQKGTNKKNKKREIADVYRRWLKEEVVYIISPEEVDAFNRLATDEEREQFIEEFWHRRDPDPDTPENEVREEHYRRIAYANEHYASGKPGWKTDRGRIYIAWGKPDQIESYPTGHVYQRQSWEGGGSTTTYAYETWWYRYLDGVGDDVEIEFVDPSGSGEYRIAQNEWEKDALLYVGNAGATEWEQLGLAKRTDRPAYGGAGNRYYNPPANKTQFARIETIAKVNRGPGASQKFPGTSLSVDLPEIETNALPFAMRTDFYRISESNVVTSLTLQIEHSDLAFENKGGVYAASVNVYAKLTQLSGKGAGSFEEVITTPRYSDQNLMLGQQQRSAFQKNILLTPGHYKIDIIARDITSGKTGIIHQSFLVPRYQESKFATSSVVLASKIEPSTNRVASPQFVVGKFKVIPNVSNTYRVGQPIGLFLQIYDADMDQQTLRPTVNVEYVISRDGKEVARIKDDASDKLYDLSGSQLSVGQQIPTDGWAPGTYMVQVRVTDAVAQKTLTPEIEFTIVE